LLIAAAVVAVVCLLLMPLVRFDFNPLNLRSSQTESVSTALDLMREPETSPNTIDALAPSLAQAVALADRLAALPEVLYAVTLQSYVPEQQEQKLALIADCAQLLDPTLNPAQVRNEPTDAENVAAMSAAAVALKEVAGDAADPAAEAARRFARVLDALVKGAPEMRARADAALVPGLRATLGQLRAALQAEAVTLNSLPPALMRDWVSADGRARVEVFPRGDSNDNETLRRFVTSVRAIVPDATGTPVSVQESSRTIVRAFIEAGVFALFSIAVLLAIALRSLRDVLLTLAPLLLAGLLTLAGQRDCAAAAQFRQHHRAAAAVRHRRRVPRLLRDGVARRRDRFTPVEPDACGAIQRAHHCHRVQQPVALRPPRHREHGRAACRVAAVHSGGGVAVPAGVAGSAAHEAVARFSRFQGRAYLRISGAV